MSFPRIASFVVITAVAVYLGLSLLLPHRRIEPALDRGPTPDQVFNARTAPLPAADAGPAAQAGSAAAPTDNARSEPKTLTEAEARKIAEEVGRKVAVQVAQQLLQQQVAKRAPAEALAEPTVSDEDLRRIAQTEVHKTAEAPSSEKPAVVAESEPAAVPKKAVKPKPLAKPAQIARAASSSAVSSSPAVTMAATAARAQAPSPEPITAWWSPATQPGSSQLGLAYAGEAASERAIALLFTAPFSNAAIAGSHIQVSNSAGLPISGQWTLAPNPRMLLLPVTAPGRYIVFVGADIADSQGKKLGTTLHGQVYVH